MKEGTYAVTVTGFLTAAEAEDYARAARESDDQLDAEVSTPEVKSYKVQLAEAEEDGSASASPAEA